MTSPGRLDQPPSSARGVDRQLQRAVRKSRARTTSAAEGTVGAAPGRVLSKMGLGLPCVSRRPRAEAGASRPATGGRTPPIRLVAGAGRVVVATVRRRQDVGPRGRGGRRGWRAEVETWPWLVGVAGPAAVAPTASDPPASRSHAVALRADARRRQVRGPRRTSSPGGRRTLRPRTALRGGAGRSEIALIAVAHATAAYFFSRCCAARRRSR